MTSRRASDHGNPAGIAVSVPSGLLRRGCGRIEISASGKAPAEEFAELLGRTPYFPQAG